MATLRTERIRELNDAFRSTFIGGQVLFTAGIEALAAERQVAVIERIRTFDDFNRENDPHEEHDFVNFEHEGRTYYAKIDYYAPDMQGQSEDPSDPSKTVRVMTIMRADEY